jgi:anti-sigma regulatory factor (Ser/Thr protein kinase)
MGLVPATIKRREPAAPCAEPARVLAFEWATADLAADSDGGLGTLAEARSAVRVVARSLWRLSPDTTNDVIQVFSELLANAMLHGEAPISVRVDQGFTGAVTIAIADAGDGLPEICRNVPEHAERLRGLLVVDGLAQAWDVHLRATGGKIVTAVVVPPLPRRTRNGTRRNATTAAASPAPRSALA